MAHKVSRRSELGIEVVAPYVKFVAFSVVVVGVAIACGVSQSQIDTNAQVSITGKVLAADGTPLANSRVALVKELDIGEAIGGLFITAATLGIACLADHPPAICAHNSYIATTGTDGAYSFSVHGGDTQGSFGVASTMGVLARVPPEAGQAAGALALAEFTLQTSSLQLPDLRIWAPRVSLSVDSRSVTARRPNLPGSGYGSDPKYWLEFDDANGRAAWVVDSLGTNATVDTRILEDLHGAVLVGARSKGTANGTTVDSTFMSGSMTFQGTAGAPPSRGAACAPVTAEATPAFKAPCSLTSGDFGTAFVGGGTPSVVVDLRGSESLSLVTIRGCLGHCTIATGTDLSAFGDAGEVLGDYATLTISPGRSARYLRVTGSPSLSQLRQISTW